MGERSPLPGAIGASHLRVYDTEGPDGLAGGTPHLHTVCSEAYYVLAGDGAVQTLTLSGFAETELEPGSMLWFTPGTIHRLVNGGGLEILVLMQNAGLPEIGDLVITFPPDCLTDTDTYRRHADLAPATARRDLGVEGFAALRDAMVAGDDGPLRAFHATASRIVGPRLGDWTDVIERGPLAEAELARERVGALVNGDVAYLADASVHRIPPNDGQRLGCCGTLGTFVP
jgi:mannose-6-phosphate isomerase-like protein (cupin superfamily)